MAHEMTFNISIKYVNGAPKMTKNGSGVLGLNTLIY